MLKLQVPLTVPRVKTMHCKKLKTLKSQIKDSTNTIWIYGLMKEVNATYDHFFVATRASLSMNTSPRHEESHEIQIAIHDNK